MKSLLALLILPMAIITAPLYANDHTSDKDAMVYRYWDWGITPQRDDYQVAVLKLALEKTRPTHGDYKIERKLETLSRSRAHRAIAQGEFLNIHASPLRPLLTEQDRREQMEESIPVKIPLMKSLLGYRSLIIRRRDYEKFSEITDAAQLQSLIAGQGRGWTDISIYEHNKYQVRGDAEYFTLFSMLLAGRFDYIPLSVIEVNGALSRFEQYSDSLMVLPDLMLYYPLPTLFHVSAKHPTLAERLEHGLTQARQDGSLDRLFEQHFSEQVQQMKSAKLRVFVLENPSVPTELGLDQPLLLSPKRYTP